MSGTLFDVNAVAAPVAPAAPAGPGRSPCCMAPMEPLTGSLWRCTDPDCGEGGGGAAWTWTKKS